MDKIELPLDLARALYNVYVSWDTTELYAIEGDWKISDNDCFEIQQAASTVDDLLTGELVAILDGPDVSS